MITLTTAALAAALALTTTTPAPEEASSTTTTPTAEQTAPSPATELFEIPDATTDGPSSTPLPAGPLPPTGELPAAGNPDTSSPGMPDVGTADTTLVWLIPNWLLEWGTPTAGDPRIWDVEQVKFDGTQYGMCQYDTGDAAALPADGFGPTLHKGEDYGWVHSWAFGVCGTPPVTPTEPPTVTPPADTVVTPDLAAVPAAAVADTVTAAPQLAQTGATTTWLLPLGAGLILSGVLLLARRLRRKASA